MHRVLALALLTLAVGAPALTLVAGEKDEVKAYGPDEKIEGKTIGAWSAEWWKWGLSFKKDRNPVTDKTGEHAAAGQSDKVWFLAGNFGGVSKRKCTIPAGRPIFVPVFNYFASEPTKDLDEAGRTKLIKAMTAEAKEVIDRGEAMSIEVNGKALKGLEKRRTVSPLFDVVAPGILDAVHPSFAGKQTGISDGYWVMLHPLPEGKHTLRIRSKLKPKAFEPPFEMDVQYEITVKAR